VRQGVNPPTATFWGGAMSSEDIEGDEWDAYVTLDTYVIPVGAGPGQPWVLLSDLSFVVLRLLVGAPGKVLESGIGR
jgi:hypothetical protein